MEFVEISIHSDGLGPARAVAPQELKTGIGWIPAKPPCFMAPYAGTPDALGEHYEEAGSTE